MRHGHSAPYSIVVTLGCVAFKIELHSEKSMAAGQPLKIVLFLGTCRQNRLGERVALMVKRELEKTNHQVEFFDPQELQLPLLEKPLHFYKDESEAPEILRRCGQKVREADAFVLVSGEYNHTIPPALTNMMDHFPLSAYSYKPSAIVCYSPASFGGMRAAMALRPFLAECSCPSIPYICTFPKAHETMEPDGTPKDDHAYSSVGKMINQLDWYATALKNQRASAGLPDMSGKRK